jgi:dolichol-phosphate mannosyltransferase
MNAGSHRGADALVCVPTYNERQNIAGIVPAILGELPEAHVLIVDDNSPDGTGEIADSLAAQDERVKVLHRAAKEGLGKAYLAAFDWALARSYKYIFVFDADFSHDPGYLPPFTGLLAEGSCDVVVGSRRVAGGGVENWGIIRRLISWAGSSYARFALGIPIKDVTGGFNGYSRDVLTAIGLRDVTSTGYCFHIELKYRSLKCGFRVREEPIVFRNRVSGKSKMSSSIISEAIVQVWKLRRLKFSGPGGQCSGTRTK